MFIFSFICDVSKGSSCSHLVLLLCWLSSQAINSSRSSSSFSSISLEVGMYSRGSENQFLSYTSMTICSMMLISKQSSVVYEYSITFKMLNTTFSLFALINCSPVATSIRVLPVGRNGCPRMTGKMILSTFTKIFSISPLEKCKAYQLTNFLQEYVLPHLTPIPCIWTMTTS